MKKLFATALTCTMLFSLAACNSRKPEQTAPESSEAVVQVTETTEAEETTTVSETAETTAPSETSEEVTTETMAAAVLNKKKKKWNYTTLEFHFPVLQIKSSYADSINKTMDKMIKKYQKDFKDKEDIGEYGTEYIAYLTKDGIMSIVFINTYPNDQIECKVYNIDVITGEKVDNARIAQIAGVSNIRKSAMNALQARYNKQKLFKVKNYKVVKKKGQKKNEDDKAVEKSFNTKHLNDKMKIGLTNEGKIFFVSGYFDGCCEDNDTVYDANGNDLYTKKNKNLVRAKY